MKIIGMTGGVGCGKSEVLNYIGKNYDATVVQADEVAHLLMLPGGACYRPIVELLGSGFTDECGNLDRRRMSSVLFRDPSIRERINKIVHPEVKRYIKKAIERERANGVPYFFVEAALLIEDNYDEICDELWYIYADEHVRRERLVRDRGYTQHKIDEIMTSQLSEEEFSDRCDFEIDNSGELSDTIKQIIQRMNTYETL